MEISDWFKILGGVITLIVGYFWKRIIKFFKQQKTIYKEKKKISHFLNNDGYNILKDIEKKFGKEIANTIIDFMRKSKSYNDNTDVRLNMLENELGIGIYVCNADGKCVYANRILCEMFGLPLNKMQGSGWLEPVIDKKKVYDDWVFSFKNGIPYNTEYDIEVNGTIKTIITKAEEEKTEDSNIVLGYIGWVKIKNNENNI